MNERAVASVNDGVAAGWPDVEPVRKINHLEKLNVSSHIEYLYYETTKQLFPCLNILPRAHPMKRMFETFILPRVQ